MYCSLKACSGIPSSLARDFMCRIWDVYGRAILSTAIELCVWELKRKWLKLKGPKCW